VLPQHNFFSSVVCFEDDLEFFKADLVWNGRSEITVDSLEVQAYCVFHFQWLVEEYS
jgi:hypothetical protein